MGKIYESVVELIGQTPLMELKKIEGKYGLEAKLYAKIESMNPAGSTKDRAALGMIRAAQADGSLLPGGTIIEPTSGNTGIGLSALAAAMGYHAVIVMPDSMSKERQLLMRSYGAELVLTDGKLGMKGAIARAEELRESIPGSIIAGQFANPANPRAHYEATGPEIWEDTDGTVDCFVAGVGSGGTISGVGRYLKERKPEIHIVAVEPERSPLLSGGEAGPHKLQGIGANFVPENLDRTVYDEVITVTDEDAYACGREMGVEEGLLVGISSGAALWAAIQVASRPDFKGKRIVVLFPDTGDHYLSTIGYYDI